MFPRELARNGTRFKVLFLQAPQFLSFYVPTECVVVVVKLNTGISLVS